jgi:hypothetical protein
VLALGTRGGSGPVRVVCPLTQTGASVRARDSATGHVHRRRCRSVPARLPTYGTAVQPRHSLLVLKSLCDITILGGSYPTFDP